MGVKTGVDFARELCVARGVTHLAELAILTVLITLGSGAASASVITFEGLGDMTPITNVVAPLKMSNAVVFTAGMSLNEFEFPPRSGTNVVIDLDGPISLTTDSNTDTFSSFSAYFTYAGLLTVAGYDATDNLLNSVNSLFSNNLAQSGDAGSSANELIHLAFSPGVRRVTITGDALGGSFAMDDLTVALSMREPGTSVPEPGTAVLLALGLGVLVAGKLPRLQRRSRELRGH